MDESTSNRVPTPNASVPWEDPATVIGASPVRLLRTLRHLRPQQWIGQLRIRARRLIEDPTRSARSVPPEMPTCRFRPHTEFLAPSAAGFKESDLRRGAFTFLSETRELGSPPNWEAPSASQLWAYNLHYFEYLWSLPFAAAANLALDWISRHTLDRGRVGWEAYPTSLRSPYGSVYRQESGCGRGWRRRRRQRERDRISWSIGCSAVAKIEGIMAAG